MSKIRTRVFQSWFRFSRSMTLGVRGVVEDAAGRVLLVRHTYTKGLFLPDGGVEKGEPAEQSLLRELVEEAGIEATSTPVLHGIYSNHSVFPNDHVLLYRVSAWQSVEATSRGEIAEIVWADPTAPPEDATPGKARRLAELYAGGKGGPYW